MTTNPPHLIFFHLTSDTHQFLTVAASEEDAKEHVLALCREHAMPKVGTLSTSIAFKDDWVEFNGYGNDPCMTWEDIKAPMPLLVQAVRLRGFPDGPRPDSKDIYSGPALVGNQCLVWTQCEASLVLDGMIMDMLNDRYVGRYTFMIAKEQAEGVQSA